MENKLLYPSLSYKVCGLLFEVHNKLGRFKKEKEYANALEIILQNNSIEYIREFYSPNEINGTKFSNYRFDFLIENCVVIETKCKSILTKDDYFQLKRYLESKNLELGLLVNFREKLLKPRRILNRKNL